MDDPIRITTAIDTPLRIIAAISIGIKNSRKRFTDGGCFQLYRVLKELYPEAEAWYDYVDGHVYTRIGDTLYDIGGAYHCEGESQTLTPLSKDIKVYADAHEWDFK